MPDKNWDRFQHELDRLRHITYRLRFLSLLIISVLVLCMFSLVGTIILYPLLYAFRFLPLAMSFLGIVLLFIFDATRKAGMVLYDEISDELEWGFRTGTTIKRDTPGTRVHMKFRVVMRSFLQSTDLPIVPGGAGQGVYFALFILLTIGTLIIFMTFRF